MAYKKSTFNPDALPAHLEPHQAAQRLNESQSPTPPAAASNQPPPLPPKEGRTQSLSPRPHPLEPRRPSGPTSTGSYPTYVSSPPPGQLGARPHAFSASSAPRPPRSPQPGQAPVPQAGTDPNLFPLFRAVDVRGTGQLQEAELGKALRNGDYTSFDPETVRLMIKMFDHDGSGTIGFDEFCGLWGFLGAWRQLFDRFDEDHSGYISLDEYTKALVAFGYHLTPSFITNMYGRYDRRGQDRMSFDLFVQSCISLKRITDVFKRYDTDRDGYITMSFEDFLTEILNQR